MNSLKKTAVVLLTVAFAFGMLLVPFTPTTQVNPKVTTPLVSTPEEVKMDLMRYLDDRSETGPLDSVLASYRDTGMLAADVVTNNGEAGILVTLEKDANLEGLEDIITINWKVDFGVATIASAFVSNVEKLVALENYDGVVTVFADRLFRGAFDDFNSMTDDLPVETEPDAWATLPYIGVDQVYTEYGYNGTGVRVATIDTGTDYSHPDLFGALDIASDGLPTAYDPTGWGFGNLLYRVNTTVVENVTAWYGYSSWNMLSYELDGKWYVNWSTCQHVDPYVNNQGGLSHLDWWFNAYLGAWWGTAHPYPNIANITDFYNTVIRQDFEIPDPTLASGGATVTIMTNTTSRANLTVPYYTTGYVFQQRWDPYTKVFAPALVLNATTILIDWNTTRAQTVFWNNAIRNTRYTGLDFNDTAVWDYYEGLGDWSFVDDWEAGKYYGNFSSNPEHLIMYHDYPADGLRFGLGTLGHTWESYFGLGMVDAIGLGGRAIAIVYDEDSHGPFVSGQIAGQGVLTYPVGPGGLSVPLPGVAPGATICGISTVGMVSEFNSFLYAAGFDMNWSSGYWEWNDESVHQMDITSNSWGWNAPQYYELWGVYSLVYAAMATPGFFHVDYPGMVQCFSAGNSGPGYGTAGPPTVPQIITVGASTAYHTFEGAYGPGQGFDQIADFSSRGPSTLGTAKPDILAPGRNTYGIVPGYGALFGARDYYAVYAGTSMACPLVAGVAALMLQARPTLDPDELKTIMQSTAVDLGLDALAQGAGRVNAYSAIQYLEGYQGYWFSTLDSGYNWAVAVDEAWSLDMVGYTRNALINDSVIALGHAPYYMDYGLYFGVVDEGDSVTMTIDTDGAWNFATFTGGWSDAQYVVDESTTTLFDTYWYNESTSASPANTSHGGWFYLNATTVPTSFATANYATISISGDQATLDNDDLWAFVFDWTDTDPANGVPDYYNGTHGDELTRWTYAGGTDNVLKIDLSSPLG
ncbi:MAG: S8 family serine peptidase, partial [Candidatus Thorarchaeota archaeon]|nr:S8 family serine peptidase [Candidatus Thorarchaeota archaeon]